MGTEILNGRSFSKDGFVFTTYADDSIVRGYGHTVVSTKTLAGEEILRFLIDMSNVAEDKQVFILPCLLNSSDQRVEFRFYEDTNYSGGNVVSTFNPNRNSSDELQTILKTGSTGDSKGTLLLTRNAFAEHKSDSKSIPYSFLILDKTKKYLAEFENKTGSETIIDYSTTLFEF